MREYRDAILRNIDQLPAKLVYRIYKQLAYDLQDKMRDLISKDQDY